MAPASDSSTESDGDLLGSGSSAESSWQLLAGQLWQSAAPEARSRHISDGLAQSLGHAPPAAAA